MEANDFEIGGRYRNEKGSYEVLVLGDGKMRVRYDSDAEQDLECALQAKIISRLNQEEMSAIPPNAAADKQKQLAWTLGALARHGTLEAHVPPQSKKGFFSTYRKHWENADEQTPGYYPIADAGSKWGPQLRISFPAKIENDERFTLPQDVQTVAAPDGQVRRINKNSFWWHLVEQLGFKLGNTQDTKRICSRLPEDLQEEFLDGTNSNF
jgi:hypothetical protein